MMDNPIQISDPSPDSRISGSDTAEFFDPDETINDTNHEHKPSYDSISDWDDEGTTSSSLSSSSNPDESLIGKLQRSKRKAKALIDLRKRLEDSIDENSLFEKTTHDEDDDDEKGFDLRDVSIWGVPLWPKKGDEGTDVVLMKFLMAQDWKVDDAFEMLRQTLKWRKEEKIDDILDEELGCDDDLANVVYVKKGADREGHPVCYNVYGAFRDKELCRKTFGTEEAVRRFLRWRVQVMERSVRGLRFGNGGVDCILQITDLKNSPGPGNKELGPASEAAVTLFQQHYPELIYKNIIINTPFWYYMYHRVLAQHCGHRTRRKFVFARPYRVTETLLKYISPENIPVEYGGLLRDDDEEFTPEDKVLEFVVKGGASACIEIPIPEAQVTIVWDLMVVGCEVSYKEEFIPDDEGSYKVLLQKEKKIAGSSRNSFYLHETGKILISLKNGSYHRKKVFCRYKCKVTLPLYILHRQQQMKVSFSDQTHV